MAFHPYPQVIAAVFNRRAFGPPRGLTPASACPRIAHPASRPRRGTQVALLRLAFAPAPFRLTSPRASDSLAHSTKGTPSHHKGAPTARGRTVSGTVSLPSRGAFHLSLTVLVRYRSQGSTQAWMVVHPGSDRVSRARPYSGTASRRPVWVRVRGCHPLRPALPCRSAPQPDLRPGAAAPRMRGPATPSAEPLPGTPARRFGHRSPFARRYSGSLEIDFLSSGYLDVSVPRVVLPAPMCSGWGYAHRCAWVRPFGDPRVEGCVLLAGDYRSLPRPSSAPCAKASAVRPWYLAGPHRARGISTCR